jgi:aminoglycoside phosphotransferase (APT) family kinase protein
LSLKKQLFLARLVDCSKTFLPSEFENLTVKGLRRIKQQGMSSVMYTFLISYTIKGLKQNTVLILRVYRKGTEGVGFKEFKLLKFLKEKDLPVPSVYCFESSDLLLNRPFMIMEKIDGKNLLAFLNAEDTALKTIDRMAEVLNRIHILDPKYYPESKALQRQFELEQKILLRNLFWIKRLPAILLRFLPYYQRRFAVAVKRLEKLEPAQFQQAIIHNDFEPDHVLISNGNCVIIDWDKAVVGDPWFDVGDIYHRLKLLVKSSKFDLSEYFVSCYQKHSGRKLSNLQFCKDMAALRLASWSLLFPFQPNISSVFTELVKAVFGIRLLSHPFRKRRRQMSMNKHHSSNFPIERCQNYIVEYFENRVLSSSAEDPF